jgi:hypothetical protein
MSPLDDVIFIVPVKENEHALYLRDGTIRVIDPRDGAVRSEAHLPALDEGEKPKAATGFRAGH